MEDFNASLVREKITFQDEDAHEVREATVIRSNRIFLKLAQATTSKEKTVEKVVVRAQNMHTTLRLSSRILFNFYQQGLFLGRELEVDWEELWQSVLSAYEKEFNANIWGSVYINGKAFFSTNTSPFVDVIEKCALLTVDNYDATMGVTETAFKKAGKSVKVEHSSNVAAVMTDNGNSMRCGIIHRSSGRDSTFNFTATGGEKSGRIVQSVGLVAAFLEGINLRHVLNDLQEKSRQGAVLKGSKTAAQLRGATARLTAIDRGISSFEETYDVKYRPERPELFSGI